MNTKSFYIFFSLILTLSIVAVYQNCMKVLPIATRQGHAGRVDLSSEIDSAVDEQSKLANTYSVKSGFKKEVIEPVKIKQSRFGFVEKSEEVYVETGSLGGGDRKFNRRDPSSDNEEQVLQKNKSKIKIVEDELNSLEKRE